MFKVIWDKLVDILGDKIVILIVGALLAIYGMFHISQRIVTPEILAGEKVKLEGKIENVKVESSQQDLLLEYKLLEMEDNSVRQQQWALEDRIEEEAIAPTVSQQSRIYEMNKRIDEIRQRKIEIQKKLQK